MTPLKRFFIATALLFSSSLAALAACPVTTADVDALINEITPVAKSQRALRTALGSGLRMDNTIGRDTRGALIELCNSVPHIEGRDVREATVEVMREYLALSDALPPAAQVNRVFDINLTAAAEREGPKTIGLALAATVPFKARVVQRLSTGFACTGIEEAIASSPDATDAMQALTRIFDPRTPQQICDLISAPANMQAVREGYARLGRLDTLRPGALDILASAAFLRWVDEDRIARMRRLMATESAIVLLLNEFVAATTIPGATDYVSSDCTPPAAERTGRYFVLTQEDIGNIKTLVSLRPILEKFAADNPRYESPGALWRDLQPVIEAELGDCIVPDIGELVLGPNTLPKSYQLSGAALPTLTGLEPLVPVAPVLEDFSKRVYPNKPEAMTALRAALSKAAAGTLRDTVETAAGAMADTAAPVSPLLDTANVEIPVEDQLLEQTIPLLGVTEAGDAAISSLIDNPGIADTVARADIAAGPTPEHIRTQVRTAASPEVQRQIAAQVDVQLALLEPSVRASFGVTEPLSQAVETLPYVRAAIADSTGMDLPTRLQALIGVEYPSQRLFREALRTLSADIDARPFSPFVIERIIAAAAKDVPQPNELRAINRLAIDGCNCTPTQRREDLHVYGFFPFWNGQRDPSVLPDDAEPDPLRQVDFGLVSDLAFYGLEFVYDENADRLTLNNSAQWQAMRRDFVNGAHHFRAKADLAFDMRHWTRWSDSAIDRAVTLIVRELQPFQRLPAYTPGKIAAAIPTLFDPVRPDGVTLIFPDYQGTDLSKPDMEKMIKIIKGVYESLPRRDEVKINVAFDFNVIVEPLNEPLFDELFQLLVEQPYVLQETTVEQVAAAAQAERDGTPLPVSRTPPDLGRVEAKVINKVLLFLERPTSDAKKGLRFRMEQGLFQGREREAVLRSIIPVLPPSGHRDILQSVKPNSPRTDAPQPFSQFEDDIVYFEDNFAGVGFWPVPDTLSVEGPKLTEIVTAEFGPLPWKRPFSGVQTLLQGACGIVCPNRSVIMLLSIAAFTVMIGLARQSFYTEWAYKIGYKLFFSAFGAVAVINFVLLGVLLALWLCDPESTAPLIMFVGLAAVVTGVMGSKAYERVKRGRMP